jgi:MFS transporter, DHA1 family, multidrug resistance protein
MMIVARALSGAGAAATRVLAISIVRDCYSGRRMARVMSLMTEKGRLFRPTQTAS